MEEKLCRIEASLGRREPCPRGACPFWCSGAEPRQGHCSLDRLDLAGREALAKWLHELRAGFAGSEPDTSAARLLFYERLNAGRAD
jgi:hypothetical protein